MLIAKKSNFLGCAHGELIRNGYCDDQANNADCIYDGGDCCGPCINAEYCTACECLGNITANNGISTALAGDHGISNKWLANGVCNDELNTPECGLDGFDCCGANVFSDNCTECTCHGNMCLIFSELILGIALQTIKNALKCFSRNPSAIEQYQDIPKKLWI